MIRLTGKETGEELIKKAKSRSLAILQRMERTEYQLRKKLKEDGYPQEVIEEAIRYVAEYRYIDDERYAISYIERNRHQKSRRLMKQELGQKGIDRELLAACLDASPDEEENALKNLIEKRMRNKTGLDEKETQRLFRYCCQKGFSFESVKKAIKEYIKSL